MNLRIDVYHHQADSGGHDEILLLLRAIRAQGEKIMAGQQDALDALKKIDDATTKQGVVLGGLGDTLQEVNNDLDDLIAKVGTSVPQDVLDGLKAAADKTQAISDSLDTHAEFSKGLAAKWQVDPVPDPVPPVVP